MVKMFYLYKKLVVHDHFNLIAHKKTNKTEMNVLKGIKTRF